MCGDIGSIAEESDDLWYASYYWFSTIGFPVVNCCFVYSNYPRCLFLLQAQIQSFLLQVISNGIKSRRIARIIRFPDT